MIYTTRCFKCGEMAVRLIMGGRSIIHARCHSCGSNLLDEVMRFEAEVSGKELGDEVSSEAFDSPPDGDHKAQPEDPRQKDQKD